MCRQLANKCANFVFLANNHVSVCVCVINIYIYAFITSNGLAHVNKVKDNILEYTIVRSYNRLITVDYIGISLDCFWRKVFAADSVFASLSSLYVFQMRCALIKPWGSF